jgi:NADP-dependent aldehyde dehydrogenase
VLRRAAAEHGIPDGVLGLVHGFEAGVELVKHPLVSAAGFTGSVRGGRALFDAAAARPVPIPFHGELGSLNPVVITEAAAAERAEAIGTGLAGSMTLGVGQFCVKPGLVLAPAGSAGDGLVKSLTDAVSNTDAGVLLDHRMRDNFVAGVTERAELPDVDAPVTPGAGSEHTVSPGFLTVPAEKLASRGSTTCSSRSASARSPWWPATTTTRRRTPCCRGCRGTSRRRFTCRRRRRPGRGAGRRSSPSSRRWPGGCW